MKRVIRLSFAIYLVLVLFGFANAQYNAITDEQKEATAVLELFLNAQIEGNTEIIKDSLGGDLLKKRLKLINNPDYAAFLRDVYKDASFEILNCKSLKKDNILIDVRIDLNEQESEEMRFLLLKKSISPDSTPQFRIYYQKEITK